MKSIPNFYDHYCKVQIRPAKKFFKNNLHHHSNALILGSPMERFNKEDIGNPHESYLYMHQKLSPNPFKPASEPSSTTNKF